MNNRNLPYGTGYADWDEEWEASLHGQHLGVFGRRIAEQLAGLVSGDTREILIYPIVPTLRSGATRTVTSAWLTIKSKETGADGSSTFDADGGKLQITTTNNPGVGQILNAATPELRFDLTAANTEKLNAHQLYYFDAQIKMSDGSIYTVEHGTFTPDKGITSATT